MKKIISISVVVTFSCLLFACETEQANRRLSGFSIGALVGSSIGAAVDKKHRGRGAAIGGLLGGLAGLSIAEMSQKATLEAAETGKETTYQNKKGKVIATPIGYDKSGKCKRIRNRTFKDGKIIAETMDMVCNDTVTNVSN